MSDSFVFDDIAAETVANQPAVNLSDVQHAARLEYAALHEESMKRMEARQAQLGVTLTVAAAFLGVGWNVGSSVGLFIYPVLALLLAAAWTQNEVRLQHLNRYLHDQLEPRLPGMAWGRYARQQESRSRVLSLPLEIFAIGGIFITTQAFAVLLGLFHFQTTNVLEWILLAASAFAIFAVFALVSYVGSQTRA